MRVLLITQYFYPENFKSNDIAFELVKKGYSVDALVGIPNYPIGKYFAGYGIFKKRKEVVNGVNVYRSFQSPRATGKVQLFLNYFTYVISACFNVLVFFSFRHYDCIIVHEPSPIFQAIPAILLKKLKRIPIYLWVLDIWPDAMKSGGGVQNSRLINLIDKVVVWTYKNCDKILISSKRFEESILQKGDFADKLIYFPNWSEDLLLDASEYPIPQLPDGFLIMIAGNLGKSQNLDAVAEAMLALKHNDRVKWIFVGDGSRKQWLDDFIQANNLTDSAFTLGRFPGEAMASFYKMANAMLVTLRGGFPHLGMVVPARLQSYMAAGRPVLAMIGNGGADIINEADCGYAVPAGDHKALVDIIESKVLSQKENFENKGRNGRLYFEKEFTKEKCINHLSDIIALKRK